MKKGFITLFFLLIATAVFAQETKSEKKIYLYGTVADSFTKAAVPDVLVTLMREDSTVVDTTRVWSSYSYSSGIGRSAGTTRYYFEISRTPAKYILKLEHPNYETAFIDYEMKTVSRRLSDIEGPKVYLKKSLRAHHFEGGELDEVVVKATKVKMVWRGDTLVYNADAFNLPEGSMLDGLIKQLPGVELTDEGEIFVNGKKIENLTLNGADFFKGKNKIMLQNLPYFTVKNVEVYKKQTEENKYLGIDDEDKKEYTMDVILKREYSIGGSANLDVGGGTNGRYKLKGFGMRFSDRTRAVLFGGLNNINENMEYSEENNSINDKTQLSGNNHVKQTGGQFIYIAPEDKLTNATEVQATWSDNRTETRSQNETYMDEASTFGLLENNSRSKPFLFELRNTLRSTGKIRLYSTANIGYKQNRQESEGWNVSTADAVMQDSINSQWNQSRSSSKQFYGNTYGYLAYRMSSGDSFMFSFQGTFSQNHNPLSTSLNLYTYHRLGTSDVRDRKTETPSNSYSYNCNFTYNYQLTPDWRMSPSLGIGYNESQGNQHEFLRDSIDYLFDTKNSYKQTTQTRDRIAGLNIDFYKQLENYFVGFYTNISANFQQQNLDYESEPLSTTLSRHYTLLNPNVFLYLMNKSREFNLQYYAHSSTPSLVNLIDRPLTSDPMNIFLGNPDLKKSMQHNWSISYSLRRDSIDQTIRFNLNGNLIHNAQTQNSTYDLTTGVRTYRPKNIKNGNWSLTLTTVWNRALDKKKFWHIGNELRLNYNKSTAPASVYQNMTTSQLSRVGTTLVNYKPSIRFQKDNYTLSLKADLSYRNIHRSLQVAAEQQPTDIWDLAYGFNGNCKLPLEMTIDTDITLHSRRGYSDHNMNDNRLYWDASLTKSFHAGQWLIKLRGYDLLGQVSNLRYNINAQGRSETWTNTMRRYAMLTLSYRFAHKPKKEK